ncbi:hypothetical protein [Clostridium sp. HBUAS56017]|uniref:hypothetical protein n=1 Tax=Clostridium sp. HBUAS56017 TaxID=2571128 RepID=UPI0011788FDE|nr:hypothetical protein [Clostridium sp. HBUAS56017]
MTNDNNILDLKKVDGIKFRIMWSTKILYLMLGITVWITIIFQIGSLLKYGLIMKSYDELVPLVVMYVLVLLLASYLNRKFLGKIVAVINEKGVYTESGVIPWNKIKEIRYNTPISLSRVADPYERYCSLTVTTCHKEYKILHAPHIMIRYIKRYVPNVEVKRDKELIVMILISLGVSVFVLIADKFKFFG